MVVTSVSTTSTVTKKKTRRREGRKKAPRIDDPVRSVEEHDENMEGPSDLSALPTSTDESAKPTESEHNVDDDDTLMIDESAAPALNPSDSATDALTFEPLSAAAQQAALAKKTEMRRIPIPPHRMTPLKNDWVNVFGPLTELLGLQVRMNVQRRCVELRTSKYTKEIGAIQKGADFVKAFALGFDVNDAIALLRMDDLYLDSFEIKDVKTLHGDHLARAIGRIAGHSGKTKFTIENASRTRVVLADTKIHILGAFQNIKVARDAIVSLILGSPPGKVYAGLRTVASRMRQRAV
ncbi:PNO1 [Sanghuangporus sanghuang]